MIQSTSDFIDNLISNTQYIEIIGSCVFFVLLLIGFKTVFDIFRWVFLGKNTLSNKYIKTIETPISLLLTIIVFVILVDLLEIKAEFISKFILALFSVCFFYFVYAFLVLSEGKIASKVAKSPSKLDDQFVPFFIRLFKILIFLVALLTFFQVLGLKVFSLLAGLGLGGLALALAAKDTASNFFGSLMILLDQPFQMGDWIKVGAVEGTVEEIGFRSTKIRTFYDSLVVMPNSRVATEDIDNFGKRNQRRYKCYLGLEYGTPNEKIKNYISSIKEYLNNHNEVYQDKKEVSFDAFNSYSLDILFYVFLNAETWTDEVRIKEEINFFLKAKAEEIGVEFAFPTQSLFLNQTANSADIN